MDRFALIAVGLATVAGVVIAACGGPSGVDAPPIDGDEHCPAATGQNDSVVEWVNFINVGDVHYLAKSDGRDLEPADLGPVVATVLCERSEALVDLRQPLRDGDAAFLPIGTEIRAVTAYDPSFRLAASHEGRIVLFEVASNPNARVGHELLDLAGKVVGLSIDRSASGAELTTISDPAELETLVAMVLAAPVDQTRGGAVGPRYILTFQLTDGTVVRRSYGFETGELAGGILLPEGFRLAIARALERGQE